MANRPARRSRRVRRDGDMLVVRNRLSFVIGRHVWLTIPLAVGAAVAPPWTSVASLAAIVVLAIRFHPVVTFTPEVVRWRTWFRTREIATQRIESLVVTNDPKPLWLPVVTAFIDRVRPGPPTAKFVATFAWRRSAAAVISAEIDRWSDEHGTTCHLPVELMRWRFRRLPSDEITALADGFPTESPVSYQEATRRKRVFFVVGYGGMGVTLALVLLLTDRPEPKPTIQEIAAGIVAPYVDAPGSADERVWTAVRESGRSTIVIPGAWATTGVEVDIGPVDEQSWSYSLRWSEGDSGVTEMVISSPRAGSAAVGGTTMWKTAASVDQRALMMLDRSVCDDHRSGDLPNIAQLALVDRNGDVAADLFISVSARDIVDSRDNCDAGPHAASPAEVIEVLRSLLICTTTGSPTPLTATCESMPVNRTDVAVGTTLLVEG